MGLYRPLDLKLDLLLIIVELMLDGELGALRNSNPHARDLDLVSLLHVSVSELGAAWPLVLRSPGRRPIGLTTLGCHLSMRSSLGHNLLRTRLGSATVAMTAAEMICNRFGLKHRCPAVLRFNVCDARSPERGPGRRWPPDESVIAYHASAPGRWLLRPRNRSLGAS
jgi:hypothetical protein